MRISYLSLLLCLTGSLSLNAQHSFWTTRDACLGQQPPSDTPRVFAPDLLAQKDTFALDRVAFSDDGKEFYYPTNNTWFDGKNSKIRYFKYEGSGWKGPFILNEHYYAPTFSMDGKSLYFEGGEKDSLHSIIWESKRTPDGQWTKPSVYLKKDYGLYDFMPTRSKVCYVGSNARQGNRKDYSTYDICALNMSAGDTTIRSLGDPINTPGFDGDFYVAPDESYMVVSARETKDFKCELYISFHRRDESWSTPVSLGPLINDGVAHRWGEYVTPDGKYLFYSRGTSPKDCHIYWVRFDNLLKKLKQENL
ncbi:MAG TPA: hypothetical protein VNS58_00150 [Puia sp.]|nr:hypothetical protein [Puia sp.]